MLLAGCAASGLDEARAACSVPGPVAEPGFDPERTPLESLVGAAAAANRAANLAAEAARINGRWETLADASRAVAVFAGVLVDARMAGEPISSVTTPQMWDQAKFAADAFAAECRAAE